MKAKSWLITFMIVAVLSLAVVAAIVIYVDPFFHYHKPLTDRYFYHINSETNQNDGIVRHFDYEMLITGTSMTENFSATEAEKAFGLETVKVSLSGSSIKEQDELIRQAIRSNPELKVVIRETNMGSFFWLKDYSPHTEAPDYLYNYDPFDDVKYIFNRDVIFSRINGMSEAREMEGFVPGITSFDVCYNWMASFMFGTNAVYEEKKPAAQVKKSNKPINPNNIAQQFSKPITNKDGVVEDHLSDDGADEIRRSYQQNVIATAQANPDITFYCMVVPYSAAWWRGIVNNNTIFKRVEAEKVAIEEMLSCPNIRIFSFNMLTDITTNLNNYKDNTHYGSWINTLMLKYMIDGKCEITADNYEQYIEDELEFYLSYDYNLLDTQEDYEYDFKALVDLKDEISELVAPLIFDKELISEGELSSAEVVNGQYNGSYGISCRGALQRDYKDPEVLPVGEYLNCSEYDGLKIELEDISQYRCLAFWGRKVKDHGQPSVYVYNEAGNIVASLSINYSELTNEWTEYEIPLRNITGPVTIVFNGSYIDSTGSPDSEYIFSNIGLY